MPIFLKSTVQSSNLSRHFMCLMTKQPSINKITRYITIYNQCFIELFKYITLLAPVHVTVTLQVKPS